MEERGKRGKEGAVWLTPLILAGLKRGKEERKKKKREGKPPPTLLGREGRRGRKRKKGKGKGQGGYRMPLSSAAISTKGEKRKEEGEKKGGKGGEEEVSGKAFAPLISSATYRWSNVNRGKRRGKKKKKGRKEIAKTTEE